MPVRDAFQRGYGRRGARGDERHAQPHRRRVARLVGRGGPLDPEALVHPLLLQVKEANRSVLHVEAVTPSPKMRNAIRAFVYNVREAGAGEAPDAAQGGKE